jgi:hypothetical protein
MTGRCERQKAMVQSVVVVDDRSVVRFGFGALEQPIRKAIRAPMAQEHRLCVIAGLR